MRDSLQKATERFDTTLGVTFPKPQFDPVKLPADITTLSSEQLAEKFSNLTAWADYVSSQFAIAVIEERNAEKKLDYLKNRLLVTKMGASARGDRVTLIKAQVAIDPDVYDLDQEYEDKYAYRKMVEMLLDNHTRDLALVSREITRRGSEQRSLRTNWGQ
jgi:hypothetical protein